MPGVITHEKWADCLDRNCSKIVNSVAVDRILNDCLSEGVFNDSVFSEIKKGKDSYTRAETLRDKLRRIDKSHYLPFLKILQKHQQSLAKELASHLDVSIGMAGLDNGPQIQIVESDLERNYPVQETTVVNVPRTRSSPLPSSSSQKVSTSVGVNVITVAQFQGQFQHGHDCILKAIQNLREDMKLYNQPDKHNQVEHEFLNKIQSGFEHLSEDMQRNQDILKKDIDCIYRSQTTMAKNIQDIKESLSENNDEISKKIHNFQEFLTSEIKEISKTVQRFQDSLHENTQTVLETTKGFQELLKNNNHILETVQDFQEMFKEETNRFLSLLESFETSLAQRNEHMTQSLDEIDMSLCQNFAHLNEQISSLKLHNDEEPNASNESSKLTLLIGDSLIQDFDENKLDNTKVQCIPEVRVDALIENTIMTADESFERIIISVGISDCSAVQHFNIERISGHFRKLISIAKTKVCTSQNVFLCSTLPRIDDDTVQENVKALNVSLQKIATEYFVTFIDSYVHFQDVDGTPHDAYFGSDSIHLTEKGSNRLAYIMKLTENKRVNICKSDTCTADTWCDLV